MLRVGDELNLEMLHLRLKKKIKKCAFHFLKTVLHRINTN